MTVGSHGHVTLCPDCRGRGQSTTNSDCPDCLGTGASYASGPLGMEPSSRWREGVCTRCNGTRRYVGFSGFCRGCNGTGEVIAVTRRVACRSCLGRRSTAIRREEIGEAAKIAAMACVACHGAGSVAEVAYMPAG